MQIQWFPGHMTKALRLMRENLKVVDVIGYVLDARAPFSCLNPEFESLTDRKPYIFILNKTDLADKVKTAEWKKYFESRGITVVAVSSIDISERKSVIAAFEKIARPFTEKYAAKGVFKPVRAMIIGVPNSGKSTLINCVSARARAATGDKPGVTKGKQWVRLGSGIELLDTPGTLWPKFTDEKTALNLAYIGSIKEEITDAAELAASFIGDIIKIYPEAFAERYRLDDLNKKSGEILTDICFKRGYLISGGQPDAERCARAVLDDFRKGKIGKITLESPL